MNGRPRRLWWWMAVLPLLATGCSGPAPQSRPQAPPSAPSPVPLPTPPVTQRPPATLPGWPAVEERYRIGDRSWAAVRLGRQHDIEGFTDRDSALPGQPVRLYVSTVARRYRVRAYRMGWYGGARARQVWASALLPGRRQRPAVVRGLTHTPSAPWAPSLLLDTSDWPPGDYLLRLDADRGGPRRFVPLTVRSPTMRGAVVLVNADTTWQAYDQWGGYSLYLGADQTREHRARAVSFDRPYGAGAGAGDFLGGELPLLALAERLGLALGYATDVDLDRDPHLLDGARAVVSLGHDEYWSPRMRTQLTRARDEGVNIAFLGANAVYRKIRFGRTGTGPYRLEINYKDATDPIGATDPSQVTTQWRDPPSRQSESTLTGMRYRCNPVRADMVVVDPGNWLLSGLGLRVGSRLPRVVGSEYDRVDLDVPTPRPIEVLTHSPVVCQGVPDAADASYYTTRSGAAVFDSGTSDWVAQLDSPNRTVRRVVGTATARLLLAFSGGPAGFTHPARDTGPRYGTHPGGAG